MRDLPPFEVELTPNGGRARKVGRAVLLPGYKPGIEVIGQPHPTADHAAVFDLSGYNLNSGPHFIVVEGPSGVAFTQQVGGINCEHPEVEGYVFPAPRELDDFGERTCKLGCYGGPLPDWLGADPIWPEINRWLRVCGNRLQVEFDIRRAKYGMECFVPVICGVDARRLFNGWLIMGNNCD